MFAVALLIVFTPFESPDSYISVNLATCGHTRLHRVGVPFYISSAIPIISSRTFHDGSHVVSSDLFCPGSCAATTG